LVIGFCFVLLFIPLVGVAAAEDISLSSAASLTEALKEIVADYQAVHPENKVLPNFASSGALAKQIAEGAPADIFISANPKWMQHLQQQELIAAAAERILARNSLVFVGMPNGAKTLHDLPGLARIALGSPASVPAGKYAEQALTKAGLYAQLQAEKKLIQTKDVRQALLYADRSEVDGAFVYRTDALLAQQAQILFAVPQELYPEVVYPAALTREGNSKKTAAEFFAFLFSPSAQQIFTKYGFAVAQ